MFIIQVIEDVEKKEYIVDIEEFHNVFGKGATIDAAFWSLTNSLITFLKNNKDIMGNKNIPTDPAILYDFLKAEYEEKGTYFPLL